LVRSEVDLAECRFASLHRMDQLTSAAVYLSRDPRGVRQVLA
jgi:hypothetical protein